MKSLYQRYSTSCNLHYSTKSTSLNQARAALNQSIDHVFVITPHPTVEGAKTSCICEPDQILFPPTQRKTEKSGLAARD